jgi:hypothetical protein
MKAPIFTLLISLSCIVTGHSQSDSSCCKIDWSAGNSIVNLGNEYKKLKEFKGDTCCSNYESLVSDLLEFTVSKLKMETSKEELIQILGKPDFTADVNNPIKNPIGKLEESESLLIYYFRSRHDYYYLLLNKGVLVDKGRYFEN